MSRINVLSKVSDFFYNQVALYESGYIYAVLPPRAWVGTPLSTLQDIGNITSGGITSG